MVWEEPDEPEEVSDLDPASTTLRTRSRTNDSESESDEDDEDEVTEYDDDDIALGGEGVLDVSLCPEH